MEVSNQLTLERILAAREVQNLLARYEYSMQAGNYLECFETFAQNQPDVRSQLFDLGVWEGSEAVKNLYTVIHCDALHGTLDGNPAGPWVKGIAWFQPLTNPLIEVAGDGKTARGLWTCPSFSARHIIDSPNQTEGFGHEAVLVWTKRACDFIKEDGAWKIWHYKVTGILNLPWGEDPCDPKFTGELDHGSRMWIKMQPAHLQPTRPAKDGGWWYSIHNHVVNEPIPPEPYETWADVKNPY